MGQGLNSLRDAAFLTGERAWAWCLALLGATVLLVGVLLATSHGGLDAIGRPLGGDFISFWSAARLAWQGEPGAAYDTGAHAAAQWAAFPTGQRDYYAFFYPPVFLLVCLWLGALPYLVALVAWLAVGFAALWGVVRAVLRPRWGGVALLAFPGVLMNGLHGQNGFLSAACFGGAVVWAGRRPFWAGACLGLLVCKPHLLVGAPVALLAGRRWALIAGAACSSGALLLLSWAVLGRAAWAGFLAVSPLARSTLEDGLVGPEKMQSVFAAVRLWGGGVGLAYAAQAAVAVGVLALLARHSTRRVSPEAAMAAVTAASLLCTPFLLDYDLVILAVPLAWVMAQALRTGFLPWEKLVLLAAYALPLLSRQIATYLLLPLGPVVLAGLLAVVLRRVRGVV